MKNFKLIKQYVGLALVSIGLFGGVLIILLSLGVHFDPNVFFIFIPPEDRASNVPFLFGILAFSGAWLLASVKDD